MDTADVFEPYESNMIQAYALAFIIMKYWQDRGYSNILTWVVPCPVAGYVVQSNLGPGGMPPSRGGVHAT